MVDDMEIKNKGGILGLLTLHLLDATTVVVFASFYGLLLPYMIYSPC